MEGLNGVESVWRRWSHTVMIGAGREVVHGVDPRLAKAVSHGEAVRLMTAAYILTGA